MKFLILILSLTLVACSTQKIPNRAIAFEYPKTDFKISNQNFNLDYSNKDNWLFFEEDNDAQKLIPKNYKFKDSLFNVSVFFIHPTTLYSTTNWNSDTAYFRNNTLLQLSIENQASVFAGVTKLYAPHYREMHIHSYNDSINGYKAFDFAYNDVREAFKYFIKNISTQKFIIASHSQGTNHATRLINEYIVPNSQIKKKLFLSYLLGMDIAEGEVELDFCDNPLDTNCFMSWRSFNESYFPTDWRYGKEVLSVNPISFNTKENWSSKQDHLGILFPNQKIRLKQSINVRNNSGVLWVSLPKNIFTKRYIDDSYHRADFNLYWLNIRRNLIERLSQFK